MTARRRNKRPVAVRFGSSSEPSCECERRSAAAVERNVRFGSKADATLMSGLGGKRTLSIHQNRSRTITMTNSHDAMSSASPISTLSLSGNLIDPLTTFVISALRRRNLRLLSETGFT